MPIWADLPILVVNDSFVVPCYNLLSTGVSSIVTVILPGHRCQIRYSISQDPSSQAVVVLDPVSSLSHQYQVCRVTWPLPRCVQLVAPKSQVRVRTDSPQPEL